MSELPSQKTLHERDDSSSLSSTRTSKRTKTENLPDEPKIEQKTKQTKRGFVKPHKTLSRSSTTNPQVCTHLSVQKTYSLRDQQPYVAIAKTRFGTSENNVRLQDNAPVVGQMTRPRQHDSDDGEAVDKKMVQYRPSQVLTTQQSSQSLLHRFEASTREFQNDIGMLLSENHHLTSRANKAERERDDLEKRLEKMEKELHGLKKRAETAVRKRDDERLKVMEAEKSAFETWAILAKSEDRNTGEVAETR